MIKNLALVFIGGGAGSSLRFLLSHYWNKGPNAIPYGTLIANISGSLLIGIILGVALKNDMLTSNTTIFLAMGFCGGYTTFSTFAYENQIFLKDGEFGLFTLYTLSSIILGIAAVFAGLWLARLFS